MDPAFMLVLMLGVADDLLVGRRSDSHHDSFLFGTARALGLSHVAAGSLALRGRRLALWMHDLPSTLHPALGPHTAQRRRRLGDVVVVGNVDAMLASGRADLAARLLFRGLRLECGLIETCHRVAD